MHEHLGVPDTQSAASARPVFPPDVYDTLATHQQTESWGSRELLAHLGEWTEIFEAEFKLGVPEVALAVDRLRYTRLGQFRYGHNGFGLRGEVVLNCRHFDRVGDWEMLGTLLHELLHGWQQAYGRPGRRNHHNTEFRARAGRLGLIVDAGGHQWYVPDGPFVRLLRSRGVPLPEWFPPPGTAVRPAGAGSSKLKKWTCGCTNVWAAVAYVQARCLRPGCGGMFRPCPAAGGRPPRASV